ncbi:hypothetical protein AH04_23 [Erwinia phage AH04]|uniref:Uncharacterized protein n=1 Tax=Erwinia phage AH04 TaxID=2869569 RepID=A0AAE7X0Q1_9CAUD|nr:hypothetical protein PQC02_gp291 [Erwinia phage AH04]QZA70510.1 hypothetical protein AH04_23 [Erwinia phage AH04]
MNGKNTKKHDGVILLYEHSGIWNAHKKVEMFEQTSLLSNDKNDWQYNKKIEQSFLT